MNVNPHDYPVDVLHGWHMELKCKTCNSLFEGSDDRIICKVCRDKWRAECSMSYHGAGVVFDYNTALNSEEVKITAGIRDPIYIKLEDLEAFGKIINKLWKK